MAEEDSKPTVWASLGMTIATRHFENNKIDIGVSGIPYDASPEYLKGVLDQSKVTLHAVVEGLAEEMQRRLKEDYGR